MVLIFSFKGKMLTWASAQHIWIGVSSYLSVLAFRSASGRIGIRQGCPDFMLVPLRIPQRRECLPPVAHFISYIVLYITLRIIISPLHDQSTLLHYTYILLCLYLYIIFCPYSIFFLFVTSFVFPEWCMTTEVMSLCIPSAVSQW